MATKAEKTLVKKITKKSINQEIQKKIFEALGEYKEAFKEHKFDSKLKKVTKLFFGVIKKDKVLVKKKNVKKKDIKKLIK